MKPSRLASGRSITVTVCLVNLLLCAPASAHPEFNPITTNRYLKLDLISPDELRLAYTVMYGDAPAAAARKEADANSDGTLDAVESQALGARLQARVTGEGGLTLTVDGQRVRPVFEPPAVGLMGNDVSPSPFSIDLVGRIPCAGPGPHEVRLDDQLELAALGETELRIEESPSTRVLTSFRGAPPGEGRQLKFLYRGPRRTSLEDRSLTFRFEGSGTPTSSHAPAARSGHRWRLAVGAALLVLLLLGAVWSYRRMKG
jgi:hypothetical protein